MCAGRGLKLPSVSSVVISHLFRQSFWIWSLPNWLIWLASLLAACWGHWWTIIPSQLFKWVLEIQTLVLTLRQQGLYLLNYLSSTSTQLLCGFWGLNPACKAGALQIELFPLLAVAFIFFFNSYTKRFVFNMFKYTPKQTNKQIFNCLVNMSSN